MACPNGFLHGLVGLSFSLLGAASEAFRAAIGTCYRIPRQLIQNRYEPIEAP